MAKLLNFDGSKENEAMPFDGDVEVEDRMEESTD